MNKSELVEKIAELMEGKRLPLVGGEAQVKDSGFWSCFAHRCDLLMRSFSRITARRLRWRSLCSRHAARVSRRWGASSDQARASTSAIKAIMIRESGIVSSSAGALCP